MQNFEKKLNSTQQFNHNSDTVTTKQIAYIIQMIARSSKDKKNNLADG